MTSYIYFLKLESELSEDFIFISTYLKKLDINLIPVSIKELKDLASCRRQFILVLNSSLQKISQFNLCRKNFLDFSLRTNKFHLIDISSFSKIDNYQLLENIGSYSHIELPLEVDLLVKKIMAIFTEKTEKTLQWPGGRRAKLPIMP